MNDFFSSLKSDLLDKRFLPVLARARRRVGRGVAYAVLGSEAPRRAPRPTSRSASSGATGTKGSVAITQAPASTSQAVAETTSGASKRSGSSRNPFTPLPEAKAKSASSSSAKSASSSSEQWVVLVVSGRQVPVQLRRHHPGDAR